MKDEKPDKNESAWVTVARYSEIGFMIPASVIVGYLLGLLGDHLLHTHWLYLAGIIFGAIAGFVSMIRRALESSKDAENAENEDSETRKVGRQQRKRPPCGMKMTARTRGTTRIHPTQRTERWMDHPRRTPTRLKIPSLPRRICGAEPSGGRARNCALQPDAAANRAHDPGFGRGKRGGRDLAPGLGRGGRSAAGDRAGMDQFPLARASVNAIAERIVNAQSKEPGASPGAPSGAAVVLRGVGRIGLIALFAYGIFECSVRGLMGFLAGLAMPVVAMMCEAAYEFVVSLHRPT